MESCNGSNPCGMRNGTNCTTACEQGAGQSVVNEAERLRKEAEEAESKRLSGKTH